MLLKENIELININGYFINIILIGSDEYKEKTLKLLNENEFSVMDDQFSYMKKMVELDRKNLILNEKNEGFSKRKQKFLQIEKNVINFILSETSENGSGPSYFGLFPTKDSLNKINEFISKEKGDSFITQKTPLHVTTYFHGGKKLEKTFEELNFFKLFKVKVLGLTTNKAGYALKVHCNELSGDHITLSTNEGFKPVDVGKSEELEFIPNEFEIECLYLPYY